MKKRFCGLLFVLISICLLSVSANAMTRDQAVNWAKTQANNKVSYDVDGLHGYQCSDFASAYINYIIYGDPYYWKNNNHAGFTTYNGCEYFYQTYPSGWKKIANTADFVPEPGDILCFAAGTKNSSGHVAIAIEGCTVSYMKAIDQNGYRQGPATYSTLKYFTDYYNFQGVIRPNFDNASSTTPPYVNLGDGFCAKITHPSTGLAVGISSTGNVELLPDDNDDSTKWYFTRNSDGTYQIASYVGAVMDVNNWGTTPGTNVGTCTSNGSTAQKWYILGENGSYTIKSICAETALDVASNHNIQMYTANNSDAQKFSITKITPFNGWITATSESGNTSLYSDENIVFNFDAIGISYFDLWLYKEDGTREEIYVGNDREIKQKLPAGEYRLTLSACNDIGWTYEFAEVNFSVVDKLKITFNTNGGVLEKTKARITYDSINGGRGENQLVIYNNSGTSTETNIYGIEVLINSSNQVIDIINRVGNATVPTAGFILSAHGEKHYWLEDNVTIGDYVNFHPDTQEVWIWSENGWLAATKIAEIGNTYGKLPTPTKDGYIFDGWYTAAEGGEKITEETIVVATSEHTLYAHWAPIDAHTSTTVNDNLFNIKCTNVENGNRVILALYKDKKFVKLYEKTYQGEDIPFTVTEDYNEVKVMIWEDLNTPKPVTAVETIK